MANTGSASGGFVGFLPLPRLAGVKRRRRVTAERGAYGCRGTTCICGTAACSRRIAGPDLPSLAAARDEALKFARQISGELDAPDRALVEVADERGSTLWMVQLSSAGGARSTRH